MNIFEKASESDESDDGLACIGHLHIRQSRGSRGYQMLVALDDAATLVVCPFSHRAVTDRYEATAGVPEHAPARENQFLQHCYAHPPVRIKLEKGYVYVLDATLLRAYAAGEPDQYSPCLQYEITDGQAQPALMLDRPRSKFMAKFGVPTSPCIRMGLSLASAQTCTETRECACKYAHEARMHPHGPRIHPLPETRMGS